MTKGHTPGLEAFGGFLLTTCLWEQGLLFHDKTPFRVSPKLCYGLGGGNCILCLNALMFYRESLRASLLYALLPETIYLRSEVSEVAQLCPTLGDPVDCSPPGSSVHGILQARILEWVAISFSRGVFPTQGPNPGLPHCRQTL